MDTKKNIKPDLALWTEAEKVIKMDQEEFGNWLSSTDELHIDEVLNLAERLTIKGKPENDQKE